jgi:hypothetical protein
VRIWVLGVLGTVAIVGIHALACVIGYWLGGVGLAPLFLLVPGMLMLCVMLVYSMGGLIDSVIALRRDTG